MRDKQQEEEDTRREKRHESTKGGYKEGKQLKTRTPSENKKWKRGREKK